jgi:hypothetical protein
MNNELYHFNHNHDKLGRFTFTRGEYSSARSEAKARRRERDKKIADEYNRTTNDIGKSFKRSLRLNDEDTARWTAATDKVQKALADSKRQYKDDLKKIKTNTKEERRNKDPFYQLKSKRDKAIVLGAAATGSVLGVLATYKVADLITDKVGKRAVDTYAFYRDINTIKFDQLGKTYRMF